MLTMIDRLVAGRPWAIRAELALHVRGLLEKEGFAALRDLAGIKAQVHADRIEARRGRGTMVASSVGVVPVIGTVTQRGDVIGSDETRSTAAVADEVVALAAEPKVDAIVLELDTPGGEVFGVPEAWAAIREVSKRKPVIASVNSVAASAGYYLASAASEVWLTPSGEVGSVGVFALHVDASRAIDEMGERWEFIEASESPFKTELAPSKPLSDDARGALQAVVDRFMGYFLRDVARGRGVGVEAVRRDFGRGRMVGPEQAKEARMVDQIGPLEMAIRRAGQLGRERRRSGDMGARAESYQAYVGGETHVESSESHGVLAVSEEAVRALREAFPEALEKKGPEKSAENGPKGDARDADVLERYRLL